jgi:hypothetical protein
MKKKIKPIPMSVEDRNTRYPLALKKLRGEKLSPAETSKLNKLNKQLRRSIVSECNEDEDVKAMKAFLKKYKNKYKL